MMGWAKDADNAEPHRKAVYIRESGSGKEKCSAYPQKVLSTGRNIPILLTTCSNRDILSK
jgi:hypothetical protein